MKKLLQKKLMCMTSVLALVLSCIVTPVMAADASQNLITVKGTVVSDDGEPLMGAAVFPKGRNADGVIVDLDGNFTIEVK